MKLEKQLLIKGGVRNLNNRVYSKETLSQLVESFDPNSQLIGEFGSSPASNPADINLANVSHQITNLYMVGDDLYCDVEILDTPSGNKLKDCYEHMAFSFRGEGVLEENDVKMLKMHAVDAILRKDWSFDGI